MADLLIDSRPFFHILHNLIRPDGLEYDPENTAASVEWVWDQAPILRRICSQAEWGVVQAFYGYWTTHKVAPDRKMMEALIRERPKPQTLLDVLDEYDKHSDDLEQVPHLNLGLYLEQRKTDYEKWKLSNALEVATQIALGSHQMNDKQKTMLAGPRDAIKYLHQRMQEGILMDDVRAAGGSLVEVGVDAVANLIDKATIGYNPTIQTLTPIDDYMRIGPDNPIKFIGLLGFSNHRKSTLLFTFAFNAAIAGHKVMVVPRECSVEDVWMRFCWLYAAQKGLADQLPDIDKALDNNHARREHRDLIRSLKQQMIEEGFNVDVVSTGEWQTIRGRLENYVDRPYDMLCVDYMAHLNTPGFSGSHQRDAIVGIFHDAQGLSQDYNDGRGLAVVTPLQANKQGEAEVRKPDAVLERGIYRDLGAIDWYTDAGRDMDAVIGIWSGDGLQEHNLAVISCVKSRSRFFKPFYMRIDPKTQMMSEVSDRQAAHIVAGGQIAAPSFEHKEQQQLSAFITSMEEVAY